MMPWKGRKTMFGRKKSSNKAGKNANVEAEREASSAKGCSSSSKQQKTNCCGKGCSRAKNSK